MESHTKTAQWVQPLRQNMSAKLQQLTYVQRITTSVQEKIIRLDAILMAVLCTSTKSYLVQRQSQISISSTWVYAKLQVYLFGFQHLDLIFDTF